MHIIAASFDPDAALSRTSEVLALGDSPERLAEKLGITRDIDMIKEGVAPASFKRLLTDIVKLKQYVEVEKQTRVQLLQAVRDYALDGSQQGDAAWIEVETDKLVFPIVNMYEHADQAFAQKVAAQLEKPLKDIDPRFLLEKFEGNRSISFDFEKGVATYYTPAPAG